jgi:hypothetical protein
VLRRGATALAVVVALALGVGGAPVGAQARAGQEVQALRAHCGYGSPHMTPGGVKCLGPDEYCSHKPGYAAAYHRAGFRCNASGRLEYD